MRRVAIEVLLTSWKSLATDQSEGWSSGGINCFNSSSQAE